MLEMSDVEEKNAKCNICGGELSLVESTLFGNRCSFCVSDIYSIGLVAWLILCFYDLMLFRVIGRLIREKGVDEARMLVLGCISECGGINMACMRTVKDKRALIKALRRSR